MERQMVEFDGELKGLTKVSVLAITSLFYCYYISAKIPRGIPRLLSLLPVICLFSILPFDLTTIHLSFLASLCLAWLANFRLILFSFDKGPLFPRPPDFLHFISITCLPIKVIRQDHNAKPRNNSSSPGKPYSTLVRGSTVLAVKAGVLTLVFHSYNYKPHLHKGVVSLLNFFHVFFLIELLMALSAIPARTINMKFEPQFQEPLLSTSLQEFWGRRWNLTVSDILRMTVYNPVRFVSVGIIGSKWAFLPAVFLTFTVSGLMHELMYYHVTRMPPTWEVTWFFILHGICVDIEIAMKKKKKVIGADKLRIHPAISRLLVLGFLLVTGSWLLVPQLVRIDIDEKAARECFLLVDFVKGMIFMPLQKQ